MRTLNLRSGLTMPIAMRQKLFVFTSAALCFAVLNVFGQGGRLAHQYTIQISSEARLNDPLLEALRRDEQLAYFETIDRIAGLYTLRFQERMTALDEQRWFENRRWIKTRQPVYPLQTRGCNPNDSAYFGQYGMELMKFDEVWCYKTDGISPLGDTLVVGVIDNGFSFGLEELYPNVYCNRAEVPDNGLDDDQNGYLDDYYGLNARSSNEGDDHIPDSHGTQVLSVIGARGNNQKGITGTNQHIRMLLCSAGTSDQLLKCYYYFIRMKREYLSSGGDHGAFMVSSNLSAGFDGYFPDDLPLVCQVYDSLGQAGILSPVATINENMDIAVAGDIPGLCPSNFMLTVTNSDRFDQKVFEAGYNAIHVDLSACGEEILMYNRFGELKEESGCSFSSPHVAGAIAQLYQFCPKLTLLNKQDPSAAALQMRKFILEGGDPLPTLAGLTSSGRRLNAFKSLAALNEFCLGNLPEDPLFELLPTLGLGIFRLKFAPKSFGNYQVRGFNAAGSSIYSKDLSYAPDVPSELEIDASDWPSGIYYLRVEGGGQSFSRPFAKFHE